MVELLLALTMLSLGAIVLLRGLIAETRWSRDIEDKAQAACLARNIFALVEADSRALLQNGKHHSDGSIECVDAFERLPFIELALGGGQGRWLDEMRQRGGFSFKLFYYPAAPVSEDGSTTDCVARLDCELRWTSKARPLCYRTSRIITH